MKLLKEVLTKVHKLGNRQSDDQHDESLPDDESLPNDESLPDNTLPDDDAESDSNEENLDDLDFDLDPSEEPVANDPNAEPTASGENAGLPGEEGDNPPSEQDSNDVSSSGDEDAQGDPDRQGVIRTVPSAHLVSKRKGDNGTYEELWIYSLGTLRDELKVRKAILAGTDIPTNRTKSPDDSQEYELWSAGNAELIHITGLPQ